MPRYEIFIDVVERYTERHVVESDSEQKAIDIAYAEALPVQEIEGRTVREISHVNKIGGELC
jgi:hypothetical protein